MSSSCPRRFGRKASCVTRPLRSFSACSFLNCKTYSIILLCHCLGLRVNVLAWLFDAVFGVTRRCGVLLSKHIMHWMLLFYQQHRVAHVPIVYQHAHKMHHYLHDSTAFDAHVYGSGAAEELCVVAAVVVSLFSV